MDQGKKQFTRLLASLQRDLEPVSTLEQLLVEKIAQEYWRLGIAAWHEADEFTRSRLFSGMPISRILRYQTTINRQLFQAMRTGDNVRAPLSVEVSHETPTISEEERLEQ